MITQNNLNISKQNISHFFNDHDTAITFIILAAINWIVNFWYSAHFGLYADDYLFITKPMAAATLSQLWRGIHHRAFIEFLQGRPFYFITSGLVSFFAAKCGGLHILYLISYIVITFNTFLFYRLLQRLLNEKIFCITGALAFCLFPSNTTKVWLTMIGINLSLTFLLLALHMYINGRKKVSYIFVLSALLSYETTVPIFLVAPLLKKRWTPGMIWELLRHTFIVGIMVIVTIIVRRIKDDLRLAKLTLSFALHRSIENTLFGPVADIQMFFGRPMETLRGLRGGLLIILAFCFIGLIWWLSRTKHDPEKAFNYAGLSRTAFFGTIMLLLSYPLTLTVRASSAVYGTATRIHFAAVVGASILCACLCSAVFFFAISYKHKFLISALLAGFFTLSIGFGLKVQQGYIDSWQYQRAFWTDLIKLCPDMAEGTVILVDTSGLPNSKYMEAYPPWILHCIPNQIYRFPRAWKKQPQVYRLRKGWQDHIALNDNQFQINGHTIDRLPHWPCENVQSSNIILLKGTNGQLARTTDHITIGNQIFKLKDASASLPFSPGYLYKYLIKTSNGNSIEGGEIAVTDR